MPEFIYTAVDDYGRENRGRTVADSEAALAGALREEGKHLVAATPAGIAATSRLSEIRILERVNRRDLIFFTNQLSTMVATGVGLVEGLKEVESQAKKMALKRVIGAIRRDVESGQSLSDAMARHPKVFNELYLNIVRAGEATGNMEQALDDLVKNLEWQDELTGRVREAAVYPVIVVTMLFMLGAVLVGFTIPRFLQTYAQLHSEMQLPLPSRMVMGLSNAIRTFGPIMVPALLVAFVGLNMYRQTPKGAIAVSRYVLRIPVIGELFRKVALSRFAHYFASLHDSGLEVAPSLAVVERLIGNPYIAQRFQVAVDRVMDGESLSRALQIVGEFPPIVIQMIALGERTGRMGKSLADVRRYFDREVDTTVKRAVALFGPIMLVVLAGVFVIMALAFYLPLFQLLRGLQ
ncbi:MAG: type II secretion system F family protein [Vicinamibacterales bacterium]